MARKEREDPMKKYGSTKFVLELNKHDYHEQKRREANALRTFFPRKKSDDDDRNPKSVAFERKWNP
jgi:hypothetical protein